MMSKKFFLTVLAVGIGGAVGSLFRYVINIQLITLMFPLGTVLENIIGSFLLGMLTGWVVHVKMNDSIKTGLGVGVCGGFTTMSTFAADFYQLLINHFWFFAGIYIFASVFGGVTLAFLGYLVGEKGSLRYRRQRAGALK